jgi:VWFA-related protein
MAVIFFGSAFVRRPKGRFHFPRVSSFHWALSAFLFLALPFFPALSAQDNPPGANPVPKPVARIDLSVVGYRQPSRGDRLTEEWSESLDFVDADHALLTFNPKKLFKRLPDCPHDHLDRLMHAVLLEVPSGKVVKETDWYLHDQRRYLWPLGSGRFLLRKLNSLYVVDSTLHEELLMSSPKDLLWVAVTPDQKEIIVETAETEKAVKGIPPGASPPPEQTKTKFRIEFLDARSWAPQRTIETNEIVDLDGTSTGYADFIHKADLWLIRFGPTPAQRKNIARLRSQSVPEVVYSSDNSLLIGRHSSTGHDYSVSAFTVSGRRLWRQRWSQFRYSPAIARNADNSRFGLSTLIVKPPSSAAATSGGDESDVNHGIEQNIQIFETASGTPIESVNVSPVVLSEQNFALSPDGRQLATIRDTAIELYALPRSCEEELAKFTALKADVPGLYMLTSNSQADFPLGPEAGPNGVTSEATDVVNDAPPLPLPGIQDPSDSVQHTPGSTAQLASFKTPDSPGAPPLPTVDRPGKDETVATFRAASQAVVVDVVVTDSKGNPVKGLRQQDFEVTEDGQPQQVRYFREFSDSRTSPASDASSMPSRAKSLPNVFSNDTRKPDLAAVTVILLDLLNTPMQDQQRARQELLKFLRTKPKDAQFALCTLSSTRGPDHTPLRLIQGFTPDETLLLTVASGKKGAPQSVSWRAAAQGMDFAVSSIKDLAKNDPMDNWQGLLVGLQEMQAEERVVDTDARVGLTIDALSQLARYLSGIPGRKNLVWLSGSFPVSIFSAESLNNSPNLDNRNYANKIKQATNLFAQGQIAVYPIDVRGLDAGNISASNIGGIAPDLIGVPSAVGQITNGGQVPKMGEITVESPYEAFQQQGMDELATRSAEIAAINQVAAETGGKAFFNTNGIKEAIATAVEQGSNYYTLSYSPANKDYNGKFRKIKIVLSQKGHHLHYRPGYFAEDPYAPAKDADLSRGIRAAAMQHGSPQSHQILFSVRVVPLGPKTKVDSAKVGEVLLASTKKPTLPAEVEVQHYSIDYAVDSFGLRFIPSQDGNYHSALTFMFESFDSDGGLLSGVSNVGTSDIEPAVYKDVLSGGCRLHQEIDVPVKAAFLRIGIQDQMSNHVGTVELPLPVPAPPDVPRLVRHSLPEIEPD